MLLAQIRPLSFILLALIAFSCSKKQEGCELSSDILAQDLDLKITRLEKEFFEANSLDEFKFLMEEHATFTKEYLQLDLYPDKDSLAEELLAVHRDSAMQVLNDSVNVIFNDFSDVEKELENAFKYIKHYFPQFQVPQVYTFVSGFNSDLIVTDELIVIGLDYFLPPSHTFQPELPRYMAERYDREYIVPMIVMAISARFNETNPQDQTLLAEMIYFGKTYHFTKAILPCTSDQFIIGYTPEAIAESFANEELIWSHFIENELLYETNPFEIRKYVGEAPFTDAISTNAPGRLGRWLGWNIVDDYVINQGIALDVLMAEPDAQKIFKNSGYRPRKIGE